MNEQVDTAEYEFLWKLLANPANPNHSYIFSLQSLVSDFPQSGVLRALLMPNGDKKHLKHAAAYFNPRVLHKLATAPDSLPKISPDQIVFSEEPEVVPADAYINLKVTEEFVPPVIAESENDFAPVVDEDVEDYKVSEVTDYDEEPTKDQYSSEAIVQSNLESVTANVDDNATVDDNSFVGETPSYAEGASPVFTPASANYHGTAIEEEPVHEEIAEAPIVDPVETVQNDTVEDGATIMSFSEAESEQGESLAKHYDTYLAEIEAAPTTPVSSYEETADLYFHQPIDDEVYDEIVSIEDIGLEQLAILNKAASDGEENYFVFEPEIAEVPQTSHDITAPVAETPIAEQPNVDQVAAFESPQAHEEQAVQHPAIITADLNSDQGQQHDAKKDMSMYHDEKMPYSFMWWLDKTRKEHADIYQPYAKHAAPATAQPQVQQQPFQKEPLDELQKQYYHAIVSTTSFTELDKIASKTALPLAARKEDKIIERFIQEEPQIKHPAGVKLDNENKAKSSSEDKEELVTETLAKIYTEQMLYHKAVLTYKKLMLKYPEKSLYFAGQIEQLESKIN